MSLSLLGPTVPPPVNLGSTPIMNDCLVNLSDNLHKTFHNGVGDAVINDTSVSITVLSSDANDTPLFDFHYASTNLNETEGSTLNVTRNSVYRIGSVSKLFTAYMLLTNYGWEHWDKPVTNYLPELRGTNKHPESAENSIDSVDWDEVKLGSLASHLSGIGRDYSNGDIASQPFPWEQAGLPKLPPNDIPDCAGNSSLPPCGRKEYFKGFTQRHPVFAPYSTPVYSNAAYRLLGYVLERLSGKKYQNLLQSSVLQPLNLTHSGTSRPTAPGVPVIPNGDSAWFQDVGDEAPTAGLYSSSLDLSRFGLAILQNRQLSSSITRRWMKPTSHTASLRLSVGSPWEIQRTMSNITNGRVIDLYTKSGSLGGYNSLVVLVPDFQISFSILAAGSSSSAAVQEATDLVVQNLLPALEKISGAQVCKSLCGTYASTAKNENSSITIAADEDGLFVQRWINRGISLDDIAKGLVEDGELQSIRLQVTNLHSSNSSHGKNANSRVSYRALFMTGSPQASSSHVFDTDAEQWSGVDSLNYGNIAVDDLNFTLDQDGQAVKLEARVLRETFQKSN